MFKKPVSLNKKNRRKEKEERGSFQKAVARPTSRLLEKERDRVFRGEKEQKRERECERRALERVGELCIASERERVCVRWRATARPCERERERDFSALFLAYQSLFGSWASSTQGFLIPASAEINICCLMTKNTSSK